MLFYNIDIGSMEWSFHEFSRREEEYRVRLTKEAKRVRHALELFVLTEPAQHDSDHAIPTTPEEYDAHVKHPVSITKAESLLTLLRDKDKLSLSELYVLLVEANYILQHYTEKNLAEIAQILGASQAIIEMPALQADYDRKQAILDISLVDTEDYRQLTQREKNRCHRHNIVSLGDLLCLESNYKRWASKTYLGGHRIGTMTLRRLQRYIDRACTTYNINPQDDITQFGYPREHSS